VIDAENGGDDSAEVYSKYEVLHVEENGL